MTMTWILIANASTAHLYQSPRAKLLVNGTDSLIPVAQFGHPESRQKGADLTTDKCGHCGHGTFVESSEPKQHEADCFAKQLAEELDNGRISNHFQDLIVVAPPQFHGRLNKHLNNQVTNLVSNWIDKDYTKIVDPRNLVVQLRDHL